MSIKITLELDSRSRGLLANPQCIHRAGCPKPDVCKEVGHCTSMTAIDLTKHCEESASAPAGPREKALNPNKHPPEWQVAAPPTEVWSQPRMFVMVVPAQHYHEEIERLSVIATAAQEFIDAYQMGNEASWMPEFDRLFKALQAPSPGEPTVPTGYTADLVRAVEHLAFEYRLNQHVANTLRQAADEIKRLAGSPEKSTAECTCVIEGEYDGCPVHDE